jgi:hypothetical protein
MTIHHAYRYGGSSPLASSLPTTRSILAPAPEFTGLIGVVDGENEMPFCQGSCLVPYNQLSAGVLLRSNATGEILVSPPRLTRGSRELQGST